MIDAFSIKEIKRNMTKEKTKKEARKMAGKQYRKRKEGKNTNETKIMHVKSKHKMKENARNNDRLGGDT